jgi:hypothetical protein
MLGSESRSPFGGDEGLLLEWLDTCYPGVGPFAFLD